MTKRQRAKAAAVLGARGGRAYAQSHTPEQHRERALRMVAASRAKRVACIRQGEVGAVGE
jgi:hypothetical protein